MKLMKKQRTFIAIGLLLTVIGCNNKTETESETEHAEHEAGHEEQTVVHLDRHKLFHTGIKVETAQNKSLPVPITLAAKVAFNERKIAHITSRVSGRVEIVKVVANDHAETGQVLVEMYSQEYVTMQFEFLQAAARWNESAKKPDNETSTAKAIYESAKQKLTLAGMTGGEIEELETGQTPKPLLFVRAPFTGTIIESSIRPGAYIQTGSELFDIADLSTLWVIADIYEKDLPFIRAGMKARVETGAYRDEIEGTITTIYSTVDEKTRTVKARIEVPNRGGRLKPEMFCTAKIQTELGKETIKIPASALLGDTEKHFVFIALNDTTFEKRDVLTGVETREFAEILDGLLVGEKIVTKGGFFLKSELLKETFGEEH